MKEITETPSVSLFSIAQGMCMIAESRVTANHENTNHLFVLNWDDVFFCCPGACDYLGGLG